MPAICRRANEIRYQYVYHRQKLGIYIYIRLSVYIKQGGGLDQSDKSVSQLA